MLLFALAIYVVTSAGWKLWTRQGAEFSLAGLIVCVVAIPVMYVLSRRNCDSQKLSAAAPFGPMQSRALPAVGWPSSSSSGSSRNC